MRNIHLTLNITPSQTYIQASWDINRSVKEKGLSWEQYTYRNNITEYNMAGGKIVEFKSNETINKEADEAKKKAEKEAENTAGLDGLVHSEKGGHKFSYRPGMKQFARFDDLYTIYEYALKPYNIQWSDMTKFGNLSVAGNALQDAIEKANPLTTQTRPHDGSQSEAGLPDIFSHHCEAHITRRQVRSGRLGCDESFKGIWKGCYLQDACIAEHQSCIEDVKDEGWYGPSQGHQAYASVRQWRPVRSSRLSV
jgi:hypothetical protein